MRGEKDVAIISEAASSGISLQVSFFFILCQTEKIDMFDLIGLIVLSIVKFIKSSYDII
jgi:hypothetical protein